MEIPENVAIIRVLRLGRWQEVSDVKCQGSRPTLLEVANLRHKDRFWASADRIKTTTRSEITIELDDPAISNIKAKDALSVLPGFYIARLQDMHGNVALWAIDWVCKRAKKGTFRPRFLQFMYVNGVDEHVTRATRWRLGEVSSALGLVLLITPKDIGSL